MNERIRELCIKSGAYEHYEVNEGVDGDELPMQKFAELIVGECAKYMSTTNIEAIPPDDKAIKVLIGVLVEDMKDYFGVE
jgi:hypothetical protein